MSDQSVTIYVCTSCRTEGQPLEPRDERAGARLYAALNEAASAEGAPKVTLVPVDCMSVCKRPVTVGFSTPGKWTYVYGDFAGQVPEAAAATILDGASRFAAAPDGLIPWKERPEALKRGVIARLPPTAA
jgi:predicted metal-binding protein